MSARKKPQTSEEALGRVYAQNCWSLAGMGAMLQQMHDLWGIEVGEAQEALRRVRGDLDEVWHGVKETPK